MTSGFIPNSFQVPNLYVDKYWYLLTGPEKDVLLYAMRRIFGFRKDFNRDRISISQFTDGLKDMQGNQLDNGTQLSKESVRKALYHLIKFGFMKRTAENDPRTNRGAEYELQLDESGIDEQALVTRFKKKKTRQAEHMQPAREKRTRPMPLYPPPSSAIGQTPSSAIGTQNTGKEREIKQGVSDSMDGARYALFGADFDLEVQPKPAAFQGTIPEIPVKLSDIPDLVTPESLGFVRLPVQPTPKRTPDQARAEIKQHLEAGLANHLAANQARPLPTGKWRDNWPQDCLWFALQFGGYFYEGQTDVNISRGSKAEWIKIFRERYIGVFDPMEIEAAVKLHKSRNLPMKNPASIIWAIEENRQQASQPENDELKARSIR